MRAAADAAQASGVHPDPLALPHTDWLRHDLTVSGPAEDVAAFAAAAAGAGVIPWEYPDLDQWEEDRMHMLLHPPDGSVGLPVASARALARALRAAMADHHARAVAQAGQSRACPLDLHALLPLPASVARQGPDDPASRAWLRRHWGTVEPLRHVRQRVIALDRRRRRTARLDYEFWSADWTPWAALTALRRRWPRLVFDLRPDYGDV
jgi:hypothetical protein